MMRGLVPHYVGVDRHADCRFFGMQNYDPPAPLRRTRVGYAGKRVGKADKPVPAGR